MDREIIAKGEQAQRVLDMPEFQQMVKQVELDLFHQFRKTNPRDRMDREDIHRVIYACDLFVDRLRKYVTRAEAERNAAKQQPYE